MNDQSDSKHNEVNNPDHQENEELPVTHTKDVEFSQEIADEDDFEALHRAELAEQRNKVDVNYNERM